MGIPHEQPRPHFLAGDPCDPACAVAPPVRSNAISKMNRRGFGIVAAIIAAGIVDIACAEDDRSFQESVQPILKEFCNNCHSAKKQKGDLDLERFTSVAEIRREPAVWERVIEQLAGGEMPPKKEPQVPVGKKAALVKWTQAMLDEVALANAGDPGPVVLRRLSNMEYSYTVRDLTGVESLDPAREFPADGAAGEGFTNAGAALVMSPPLLTKYLDAAKEITSHAVLLPDGIRFSPSASPRDWTNEALAGIREFYAQFSEAGGAMAVNLQGIKFDTNSGGRLPVEKYVVALLKERDALREGRKVIADVARDHTLNAKYAATLWTALNERKPSPVLDGVRQKFRTASPGDAAAVAKTIQDWQQSLWRFASVGHIGKVNGPRGWQEPVTPLAAQHELRVKLAAPKDGGDVMLFLAANGVGDGAAKGPVVWENARLVAVAGKSGKDVPLRDIPGALPDAMSAQAGAVIEIRIPAAQIKDAEFAVTARLDAASDDDSALQVQAGTARPENAGGLIATRAESAMAKGQWSDNNLRTLHSAPVLVRDGSAARRRLETAFDEFRQLFPAALCYTKIVPVDEVVTLTLYHREDAELKRLMLDDAQSAALDRMWDELHFVSESALKQVDGFEQLYQFATQDAKPSAFEPMREPIMRAAEAFRKRLVEAEPGHVQAVLDFAARAWRRPLTGAEHGDLRALYEKLRAQELPHAAAVRMLLARVLVAPAFLYRGEKAAPGVKAAPVNDWELATRLSYFLWSSAPDEDLRALAASGKLHEPPVLAAQARRMMRDAKVRRLATEFGCQWLHIRDVATMDEKSERHFPTFASLRGAMQEEAVRFFTDLFQEDRSVLSLLDADHTFVNGDLAKHYGIDLGADSSNSKFQIPNSKLNAWQRVDGLRARGRGGILGFASTLAKQSGASRTSPILRGNWLSEVVLGEKLPRPPKGVPVLPDEAPQGLTERQLIERHSGDAQCAKCHQRIDPFGFALEGFDAIGRARSKDAGGLAIDTHVKLPDGTAFDGLDGLRSYLVNTRRDDFLRQFCRKLLGYALGRSVQLSDKPLIESMLVRLKANDHKVSTAVELIVLSPQFREVRGRDFKVD